jgi:lysine-specific demethylase/histidyl-hydroxylase NO66
VPEGALERCAGDPAAFAAEYWGRRPLLRQASSEAGFADLLDLPDVDHLITETLLRVPSFRLVKDGRPLDPSSYTQTIRIGSARVDRTVRPERVAEAFAAGATIVLQALHRLSPQVARFCRDLEIALSHPVQANAYVTPPTSRGFSIHHDTHDVFVLQTHGHKRWRVYTPIVELAGPEQAWSPKLGSPEEPELEAELGPGDSLYIPRGFPHDAEAREEVSIHVTVGINTSRWVDFWRHVMSRAPDHLPFREALPVGFARDPDALAAELPERAAEFRAWMDEAAGPEAIASFARRFWTSRRPLLAGQLEQLERLRGADEKTTFRRRWGSVFMVSVDADHATVLLGNRELRMPVRAGSALRFIEQADDGFAVADLPDDLDRESRLVLLRRLVREGALEIVDDGG